MSFSLPRLVWIGLKAKLAGSVGFSGPRRLHARIHHARYVFVLVGRPFGHAQSFSAVVSLLFTPIIQTMSTWPNFRGCHLPTELHGLSDRE
jgi:hypothetical protein